MVVFRGFFNVLAQKTLRASPAVNLAAYDRYAGPGKTRAPTSSRRRLYTLKRIPVITPEAAAQYRLVDPLAYQAA